MHEWLGFGAFFQTLVRVLVVWAAFYGAGTFLRKPLRINRFFPLIPNEITGLFAFVVLTIPLSLFGILNRTVCPIILLPMALPGMMKGYGALKTKLRKPGIFTIILMIILAGVLLLNFTHASMPNLAFDDPLVTYAVQPDRWLNTGRIFWITDTAFSGFPLLYEMTAVWPASLASDRMNQLSVLQVFQMTLLVVALFRSLQILRIRKNIALSAGIITLLTTALFIWASMAKTDAMAILFSTLALTAAVKQKEGSFSGSPLSSWLFMGAALATKQTAALILAPFILYSFRNFFRYSMKLKAATLGLLIILPGAFAVRTLIVTGSPTYPVYPVKSMVNRNWELNEPEENTAINTRSSYLYEQRDFPMLKHLGIFFANMEGNILLLLAGIAVVLLTGKWRLSLLAIPVLVYCAFALLFFWPPWWGAKYSVLIYPFVAILGVFFFQSIKKGEMVSIALIVPSFLIPGFIATAGDARPFEYRYTVARSVLSGNWSGSEMGYSIIMCTPEGMTHMWANAAFPPETVILSLLEEKRYFFNGTVIAGWRHPIGQALYEDNSLSDELAILDSLEVDYVGFYRDNPAILEQENRLLILDHIGTGDILEPVIAINSGYVLCRYNRP